MRADIEKFYNSVAQNPALLNKLTSNAATPDEFIDHAVKEASAQGFSITHDEARTWIDSQIAASQNGELTDVQLESVAGGKPGGTFIPGSIKCEVSNCPPMLASPMPAFPKGISSLNGVPVPNSHA